MELGSIDLSFEPWSTPEEFARFLEADREEFRKVTTEANIELQ